MEKPLFDVADFGNANVQHANVLSLMDCAYTSILANTFSVTSSSVLSTLFLLVLKHVYHFSWTFKGGSFESGDGCTSLVGSAREIGVKQLGGFKKELIRGFNRAYPR